VVKIRDLNEAHGAPPLSGAPHVVLLASILRLTRAKKMTTMKT
jgi:hypothetical protein